VSAWKWMMGRELLLEERVLQVALPQPPGTTRLLLLLPSPRHPALAPEPTSEAQPSWACSTALEPHVHR